MIYKIGDVITDSGGTIKITHVRQVKVKDYTDYLYTGNVLLKSGKEGKGFKLRSIYHENILKP